MKLIKKISKNTFTEKITKKYSTIVRVVSNFILIPLIILCFIMFIGYNLTHQTALSLISIGCSIILMFLLFIIQHKERMRIIKNDQKLKSILIKKSEWYKLDRLNFSKFNAIMKKRIIKSLRDKDGFVSTNIIEMLIAELKDNNERFIKKYITFGVILAFLINPIYTSHSEKFVDFTYTFPLFWNLISNAIVVVGIFYFTLLITNSEPIYLGFTKGYYGRIALIEQLYDIKADTLLNQVNSIRSSTYEVYD